MNELTREACLCHFGFKKGDERPNHKYYARIATVIPGRYRYFYTKAEYDAYKSGGKSIAKQKIKSNMNWANHLNMVTTADQARKWNEAQRKPDSDAWENLIKKQKKDIKKKVLSDRLNDLKNLTQTTKEVYEQRALQDPELRKQHVREINETRKESNRRNIAALKSKIQEIKQEIKNVKMSELDNEDKKMLISIGKASAKDIIRGTLGNMFVSNLSAIALIIDRYTDNQNYREYQMPNKSTNTTTKPAYQGRKRLAYQKR